MKARFRLVLIIACAGLVSCDLINSILNITPIHDNPNDPLAPVAAPVFSPVESIVTYGTQISMTCATEGAEIHYTT